MKPDLRYNLFKYFLHASLPPSRNCWWIPCVLTLLKQLFFPVAALLHNATALKSSSTSWQGRPRAAPSTPLACCKENVVQLSRRYPGVQ